MECLDPDPTEWFCRRGKTQGEIILDMDSTEDPTYGQQPLFLTVLDRLAALGPSG